MLGDNIYEHGNPAGYARRFEQPYGPLLSGGVKFYAALGNHDVRRNNWKYAVEYAGFNMGGRRYYTFRYGDDLVLLAITRKCGILNWRRGGVRDLPMGSLGRNPSTRQRFFFAGNGSTPWEEESRAAPQ